MTAERPTLQAIIDALELTVLTGPGDFSATHPSAGYTSDLLSCVMAGAARHGIWVTLQAHNNIVAVAALLELGAVIITEGAMPDPGTIAKASEEGVTLLSTNRSSFEVNGKLWEMGLRAG
jgi:imidazolonepropionase-like amidohydrolase